MTHITTEVADEVTNEVVQEDAPVADDMAQLDVVVADEVAFTNPIQSATANIEVTTPSTEPSVHIDGAFLGGPI